MKGEKNAAGEFQLPVVVYQPLHPTMTVWDSELLLLLSL